jgi:hypothetical protein
MNAILYSERVHAKKDRTLVACLRGQSYVGTSETFQARDHERAGSVNRFADVLSTPPPKKVRINARTGFDFLVIAQLSRSCLSRLGRKTCTVLLRCCV